MSSFGLDFTYNHFTLGLEYKKGESRLEYEYFVQYYSNGNPNATTNIGNVTGLHKTNSFCVSLGYSFYKSTLKKLPHY